MNETIATEDITSRARAAGWDFSGLVVKAHLSPDHDSMPDDAECYTSAQKSAWISGDWQYGIVTVTVKGGNGFEWGSASLASVEYGHWTDTDEHDNVTGTRELNPLTDEEHPIPDLITEAMEEAVRNINTFVVPTIAKKSGVSA